MFCVSVPLVNCMRCDGSIEIVWAWNRHQQNVFVNNGTWNVSGARGSIGHVGKTSSEFPYLCVNFALLFVFCVAQKTLFSFFLSTHNFQRPRVWFAYYKHFRFLLHKNAPFEFLLIVFSTAIFSASIYDDDDDDRDVFGSWRKKKLEIGLMASKKKIARSNCVCLCATNFSIGIKIRSYKCWRCKLP